MYISMDNNKIARLDINNGQLTNPYSGDGTAAVKDGPVAFAQWNEPAQMFYDSSGPGYLWVASHGGEIRMIKMSNQKVVTMSGGSGIGYVDGNAAKFYHPVGIGGCVLSGQSSPTLFIADAWNHRIRKLENISGNTWTATTLAGGGPTMTASYGSKNDGSFTSARFSFPHGIGVYNGPTGYGARRAAIARPLLNMHTCSPLNQIDARVLPAARTPGSKFLLQAKQTLCVCLTWLRVKSPRSEA